MGKVEERQGEQLQSFSDPTEEKETIIPAILVRSLTAVGGSHAGRSKAGRWRGDGWRTRQTRQGEVRTRDLQTAPARPRCCRGLRAWQGLWLDSSRWGSDLQGTGCTLPAGCTDLCSRLQPQPLCIGAQPAVCSRPAGCSEVAAIQTSLQGVTGLAKHSHRTTKPNLSLHSCR